MTTHRGESKIETNDDLAAQVRRPPWAESWALLFIAALLSLDLLVDVEGGRSRLHVGLELGAAFVALAGIAWVWIRSIRLRRELAKRIDLLTDHDGPSARW